MPIKGMLIQDYKNIEADTYGWIHSIENNIVNFEIRDKYYKIPKIQIVELPVPLPSLNELAAKDPCFKIPLDKGFELIFHDEDNWYKIYKCKKHGRYFLDDTRGTWFIYGRLIFLEETDITDFYNIYRKYHQISDNMLNYLKIAC